jgi:hypothetical protein
VSKQFEKDLTPFEGCLDLIFVDKLKKGGRKKRRKEGKKEGRDERRNVHITYIHLLIIYIECSGSRIPKQTGHL